MERLLSQSGPSQLRCGASLTFDGLVKLPASAQQKFNFFSLEKMTVCHMTVI